MLVQKKVSSKKNLVLGIVLIVVLVATVLFLYFTVIRQPEADLGLAGATGQALLPSSRLDTTFETELFEDPRVQNLKQYGPAIVEVVERGRKANPFEAF